MDSEAVPCTVTFDREIFWCFPCLGQTPLTGADGQTSGAEEIRLARFQLGASGGGKPLAKAAKRGSYARRSSLLAAGVGSGVGVGGRQHSSWRRFYGRTAQTLDKLI